MQLILFLISSLFLSAAQGLALKKRTARESSPSGCLVVQGTDTASGQYATFGAAITALGSGTTAQCIFIYPGTYKEQVRVAYGGSLTIYGYTSDTADYKNNVVTIESSQTSTEAGTLDASSAVNFVNNNLKVYNVNFANTYGQGSQAVAMTANGDYQGFYGCKFLGWQDTLYAKAGQQYYKRCYIEGGVDFIFGDAAAWFGVCTIAAKQSGGSITANSRETSSDISWYVIDTSTIEAASGYSLSGEVYLGRPWRVLARVIYQNSVLSNIINAVGWTTMAADATPVFEEYNNSGAGSSTTSREYDTTATAAVTKTQLWEDSYDDWIDASY